MNIMNLYVYENRSMSNDLSRPLMLENLNVDTVKVHIPKEIDGTDMGTWAWWFVYQNAKREKYSIPMTLEGTTSDDGEEEYISTVGLNHGFTGKHGTVMYAIEAIQADGSGAVTHEWHTKTCKLEIVYTLQGNQTEFDESESDIISALISRVNELIQSGAEIAEIAETIENAAETAQEVIDSIPADYSALSDQVDTNTAAIAIKANQATTYTKTEVDTLIEEVEVETDTTLSVSGAPADAKKTGDALSALEDQFSEETDKLKADLAYYTEEDISVYASSEGWRLDETGKCTEASSYKLVKYAVTAGDTLHLILSKDVTGSEDEGVYQWQNAASVPSSLPNSGLVGTPVTDAVNRLVTVPEDATYLIVSQFKTNTTNSVKLVTDSETLKEKIEDLEETVDNIEQGLSADAKDALMACFAHVKWSDDQGQDYYDDLYNALYGVQPDPEVPNAYTRYSYIKLKKWSEVPSGTYEETSDPERKDVVNVGVPFGGVIKTDTYSDLNQLNIKVTAGVVQSSYLSDSKNGCPLGGGTSSNATSRLGLYLNFKKQWIYCMMHGVERQIVQALQDVNVIEIINGSVSPSTVKINGTENSFAWSNSNVINSPIALFSAQNFSTTNTYAYSCPFIKTGEIEISNQNSEVISKLIPVVRKADNVIGLWDSVLREFHTAATIKYATIGDTSCIYDVGNWE